VSAADPDTQRAEMLERWDRAAVGWGKRADGVRGQGMPVTLVMIERLGLQPGQRLLELAAGPGDTGFLAAELIQPGGTLICSDASERMLEVARERARRLGISNVEFEQLQLEWIDLTTASVDAILCRWALMLSVDPAAALHEMRRVLRPGGRLALAVWDAPERNPWATIPTRVLVERGFAEPAPVGPGTPGMFALAAPGLLEEMLSGAGFVEVVVEPVAIERAHVSVEQYVDEMLDLSLSFSEAIGRLSREQRAAVRSAIGELVAPFRDAGGRFVLPGRSLVASAGA